MAGKALFGLLSAYYGVLLVLTVYALHRLHLVRLRRRVRPPASLSSTIEWPSITIQLPIYNEPAVAARVILAATRLQYPGALDIQILDDSTDATSALIAPILSEARAAGMEIAQIRRGSRAGFKAGALAHGMALSRAQLFAIFDADFLPQPDTLVRMVPAFADATVGMVQARWGHLNREESRLTRTQAIFLDAHFAVESAARFGSGAYFNFNGTAGIWRREAIEDAGGWSAETLTEDLDLSYRSQLAGWRFVFLENVEVPGELPPTMGAFQEQQFRWAKGSAQTAQKLLGRVFRAGLSTSARIEAAFHLTGNFAYLLTICLAMLIVPSMEARHRLVSPASYAADAVLFVIGTCSVLAFYIEGQHRVGRPTPWRDLALLIPIGVSLSLRNSTALIEGLVSKGGEFRRTPKRGDSFALPEAVTRWPLPELLLTGYIALALVTAVIESQYLRLPFLAIFFGGYGYAASRLLMEHFGNRTHHSHSSDSLLDDCGGWRHQPGPDQMAASVFLPKTSRR